MGSGRRWALELSDNSGGDIFYPPGFSCSQPDQDDSRLSRQKKDAESRWKAWEVAQAPAKNLMMLGFMMWMAGTTVHLFSIGSLAADNCSPRPGESVRADNKVDLILPKLVYMALNLVGLGIGVWKLNTLGLLPTHASDWVPSLPPAPVRY